MSHINYIYYMAMIKVVAYSTSLNKEPFMNWLEDLDLKTQAIVLERLDRVKLGNFGDCKLIQGGEGISELRINYGPGYRVYFGRYKMIIVVLLIGGTKGSQARDIAKAKRYWLDYRESLDEKE